MRLEWAPRHEHTNLKPETWNLKPQSQIRGWVAPLTWPLLFIATLSLHFLWVGLNDAPPVWDMAYHQLKGWEYLAAWREARLFEEFSRLSSYYPPLYYLQEALVLLFFPNTHYLAIVSNLTGLFLLSYCTFRIATRYVGPSLAALTGWLPLMFPLVAWTSHESLLDMPLAGWVAAGGYLLLKSDLLERKGWSFAFGLIFVAGILTKWTFVLFICSPLIYALVYSKERKKAVLNLVDALILATPLIFWWYLPNLNALLERFEMTAQAAVVERDPGLTSLLGWLYYPRSLASYYLYLPLTILFVWGVRRSLKVNQVNSVGSLALGPMRANFLWWWLLGGLLLLTLLNAKDPRYVMPLVSPLAILLVYVWRERRGWLVAIFAIAFLQFVSVSFSLPFVPEKVALFDLSDDTDYRSMRQEWVLYQSHYFDVVGPPRREQWHYQEILDAVPPGNLIGFVPDHPRFHPTGLELHALRRGRRQEVTRLGQSVDSIDALSSLDFVVGKTGFQGISYITRFNGDVYDHLEEQAWPRLWAWELPDQSQALLWQNPGPARSK